MWGRPCRKLPGLGRGQDTEGARPEGEGDCSPAASNPIFTGFDIFGTIEDGERDFRPRPLGHCQSWALLESNPKCIPQNGLRPWASTRGVTQVACPSQCPRNQSLHL